MKELKDNSFTFLSSARISLVESGEGIERRSDVTFGAASEPSVESGEGIER